MPADVDTFNMHRENILRGFSREQLEAEIPRLLAMVEAVLAYHALIVRIMAELPQSPS